MLAFAVALASVMAAPHTASAESLFNFLFGGLQKDLERPAPASFVADPSSSNSQPASPPRHRAEAD